VTSLVVFGSRIGVAQGNPFVGTWALNVSKSKYTPGPPPKDQTVVNEAAGQGMKTTATGHDASGKPISVTFVATFDAKDFTVSGSPDYDTQAYRRIDANSLEVTRKKAGKVVQTGTNVVSKDGKTRTISITGVDAQGRKINNVSVYEKK
jgi:hypothetical protein